MYNTWLPKLTYSGKWNHVLKRWEMNTGIKHKNAKFTFHKWRDIIISSPQNKGNKAWRISAGKFSGKNCGITSTLEKLKRILELQKWSKLVYLDFYWMNEFRIFILQVPPHNNNIVYISCIYIFYRTFLNSAPYIFLILIKYWDIFKQRYFRI